MDGQARVIDMRIDKRNKRAARAACVPDSVAVAAARLSRHQIAPAA